MKKQTSDSAMKDQKNAGSTKTASQNKGEKGGQTNGHSSSGATSKVKAKTGHGMSNEGTNTKYGDED